MFEKLDKTDFMNAEEADGLGVTLNMPIDNKYFRPHSGFFTSIGYIAHQVAMIEDEIRQSMFQITEDYEAVIEQTGKNSNRNLGGLISLYELVFLAKFGSDEYLKKCFYAVKELALKANKYRNEAVHSNWMFIGRGASKPCFEDRKRDGYVIISPKLMRERAIFVYTVYEYIKHLRAVTEDPGSYSPEFIVEARSNLQNLLNRVLKIRRYKK